MPNQYTPTRPRISPVVFNQVRRNLNREFAVMNATMEFHRLQNLNLNSFTRPTQALAHTFATNMINGYRGNNAAMTRALNALPRVRRIGGGNATQREHRAATTIQARRRGMAGRKRANARRTKLVRGPGGNLNYMVAVPMRR
jgi:hypothetical protein